MKRQPFLLASLTIGVIFLFFLLVIFAAGMFGEHSLVVSVGDKLGILEVYGEIVDAKPLCDQIAELRDNDAVKAVVLRLDSPGGGVGPSQEIYAELQKLANQKPLVVSMGAVAASGAYYLAVAGKRIFANPGTITGSIGVIMSFPDYQELLGKVGVKTETVKSGRFKDIGSSTRAFTAADRELLQGMIDDVHDQFVEAVSLGRSMPEERLRPYVDGRIFTGRQALAIGLVDELGTLNDAIAYAAQIVGLGEDPDLVYPEPEDEEFLERLLRGAVNRYLNLDIRPQFSGGPKYLWDGLGMSSL